MSAAFDDTRATAAACMLCYIRDLLMASPKDSFSKPELLVMLEVISRDPELFDDDIGIKVWQDDED